MTDSRSYRSIVGILLYLASNTRPDIQLSVSQVARFSHAPKQSHDKAVKRIIQYLKGSNEQGCLFAKPTNTILNLYVDSDFAGMWGSNQATNSISVKSRNGSLVISYQSHLFRHRLPRAPVKQNMSP